MEPEYILRWKMFEWVHRPEKPLHETRIEMVLGGHIVDRVLGDSGAPRVLDLWAFEFKEVDSEGRRVYEATADPYEGAVEKLAQENLARHIQAHEEEIKDAGSSAEG